MTILEQDLKTILSDSAVEWRSFNNASILVTGATGLIGSLIVKTLLQVSGVKQVYALVRSLEKGQNMLGSDARFVLGDVRDPIHLDADVDYIIHCASVTSSKYMITNPVETMSISIDGTKNVLEFARSHSVKKVLFLSTMEVYGMTSLEQNPVTEEKLGYIDLSKPRSSYPESKRLSELLCNAYFNQYGVPTVIARLSQTFGAGIPLTDNRVSMQFAKSALKGEDIVLHTTGQSVSNFCYTTDAIRALFLLLLRGQPGHSYNVSNDEETRTIAQIADLVAGKVAEGKIKVVFKIPDGNVHGYAADTTMRLSSKKLISLGWKPSVGMAEAYQRLIRFLKEEMQN